MFYFYISHSYGVNTPAGQLERVCLPAFCFVTSPVLFCFNSPVFHQHVSQTTMCQHVTTCKAGPERPIYGNTFCFVTDPPLLERPIKVLKPSRNVCEVLQVNMGETNRPVFHQRSKQTHTDLWLACLLLHSDACPGGGENVLLNEVMKKWNPSVWPPHTFLSRFSSHSCFRKNPCVR